MCRYKGWIGHYPHLAPRWRYGRTWTQRVRSTVRFDIEGNAPVTKTALAHNYKAAPRIVIGHDSSTTAAYGMDYDDIFVRVK